MGPVSLSLRECAKRRPLTSSHSRCPEPPPVSPFTVRPHGHHVMMACAIVGACLLSPSVHHITHRMPCRPPCCPSAVSLRTRGGTAAGLPTDQARRTGGEEGKNLNALEAFPEHHLASAIHPTNRKNGLCETHASRCNLHCRLPPVRGTSHTPPLALLMPVREGRPYHYVYLP